ncbi:MAG: DUF485 domain-containing protein [Desulforudis sp.]|jgi:uncharacterized membrane protein (DUF485 family)|nr:MAG: DUF485 domain-containing protein [Desulforudis sp.]
MNPVPTEAVRTDLNPERSMDVHSEQYLNVVMVTQLRLSLKLSAIFVAILLGLPLANFYFPEIMNTRILGFTATWLFLGVLFYPLTWLIAKIYISKSLAMEHEIASWAMWPGEEAK